jgi:hypothetical protein
MTSQIDVTVPVAGTPTTASVRANFQTAANEISALQAATTGGPFLALAGGTMTGPMYLAGDPTDVRMPATKAYVDAHAGSGGGTGIPEAPTDGALYGRSNGAWFPAVPIAGGTMTAPLRLPNGTLAAPALAVGGADTGLYRTGTSLVVSLQGVAAWTYTTTGAQAAAQLDMTTHAIINLANPTNAQDAATKAYVDSHAWVEAPNDANTYGRHALGWVKAVPFAPRGSIAGLAYGEPANIVPNATLLSQFAVHASVGFNIYFDGTAWRYLGNGYGKLESFDGSTGLLSWFGFPTGVAGAVANPTQLATLDTSGNVTAASLRANGGIFPAYSTTTAFNLSADASYYYVNYQSGYALAWARGTGNLLYIANSNVVFQITSTGVVQVPTGDHSICGIGGGSYVTLSGSTDLPYGGNLIMSGGGRGSYCSEIYWSTSRIWTLDVNGNVWMNGSCSATSYPGPSDARIKKNVQPWTTRGLADVIQLQPVSYQFNGEGGTRDDGVTRYGVIAQEAQACLPEAVVILAPATDLPDPEPRSIADQLAFDNGTLVFALVNAVKELAARVATLEGTAA